MKKGLLWLIGFCALPAFLWSQSNPLSNKRQRHVAIQTPIQQMDTLTLVPGTVRIRLDSQWLDTTWFECQNTHIVWHKTPEADSVFVQYRVFPFDLGQSRQLRDSARMFPEEQTDYIGFVYQPFEQQEEFLDFQGLDYNGSFSRGLSFGNRQDLVLNSAFNLQMSGRLGEDVDMLAAISDNNIPIQPEGNTQQLQEFDKIFIQLKRKQSQLTAGDYEIQRPHGYFMNYYKKLQGATFSQQTDLPDGGVLQSEASLAISRGKFARNQITPQEGNQGPYRLQGAEGEQFIIILAGTEKVFWDGQLLRRGLEYDYVIDYNLGTLTFTSRRLITKDIRVIVEFEYTTQQYLRSLVAVNTHYKKDRWEAYLNVYSEQDGKNSGEARNLTLTQRRELAEAGDAPQGVLVNGERPSEGNNNPVRYLKLPNPDPCGPDSIYVQTDADQAVTFSVSFTELGPGQGNYLRLPAEAFGTVYAYSPPDENCRPTGTHAPVVKLVTPQQLQMYTAGGSYRWSEESFLQAELGLSQRDLNRFSDIDDGDNTGGSIFLKGGHEEAFASTWSAQLQGQYEYVNRNFRALNPYRAPEFIRDWNLDNLPISSREEHFGTAWLNVRSDSLGTLGYGLSLFSRDSVFEGLKHLYQLDVQQGNWQLRGTGSWLLSEGIRESTSFFRPRLELSRQLPGLGNWRIGLYGEWEDNRRAVLGTDSLNGRSFRYDLHRFFIETPETGPFQWRATLEQRIDFLPQAGNLKKVTEARNFLLNGRWKPSSGGQLNWNLAVRRLEVQDTALSGQQAQNTFLGRVDYNFKAFEGLLRSSTLYEISSGQEQKFEFVYQEVQPGEEGTHLWEDRNEDGKIQFDEVELPPFPEAANVRRITQFTDEFIRTDNVQLNQLLRIEPRFILRKQKGIENIAKRFSAQLSMLILRKSRQNSARVQPWNPLQLDLPDSSLVAVTSTFRGDLFFNQANPKYNLQLSRLDNRTRSVLTTGFESRRNEESLVRIRWNFTSKLNTTIESGLGSQQSDSEFFNSRDYRIEFWRVQPQLSWQPDSRFRGSLTYLLRNSENVLSQEEPERSIQQDLRLDLTFNSNANTSLRSSLSFVQIKFQGEANSPVGFALLQGLQNGQNFLWNLGIDRRLTNSIQLSFNYEGRKTGDAPMVHIGRAQVRAVF